MGKRYQFRKPIILFQEADTLRLVKIHTIFCFPRAAKNTRISSETIFLLGYFFLTFNLTSLRKTFELLYLFRQMWILYNCMYHDTIRWTCWLRLSPSVTRWVISLELPTLYEKCLNLLFIQANMNYAHLYISWLNNIYLLKSPILVDFCLYLKCKWVFEWNVITTIFWFPWIGY